MCKKLNDYLNKTLSEDTSKVAMAAIKTTKQVIFIKQPQEEILEDKSYLLRQSLERDGANKTCINVILKMAEELENLEKQVEENNIKLDKITEMFDETQKKINNLESIIENIKRNQVALFDVKERVLEALDTETIPF